MSTSNTNYDGYGGVTGGSGAYGDASTTLRCATNAGNADYTILELLFPMTADNGDTLATCTVTLTYTAAPTGSQPISVIAAIEPAVFNGVYTTWDDLRDAYDNAVVQGFSNSAQTLSGGASAGGTVVFDIKTHIQALLDAAGPGDFGGFTFFLKANDDPNGFGAEHFFAAIENTTYAEALLTYTLATTNTYNETGSGGVVVAGFAGVVKGFIYNNSGSGGALTGGTCVIKKVGKFFTQSTNNDTTSDTATVNQDLALTVGTSTSASTAINSTTLTECLVFDCLVGSMAVAATANYDVSLNVSTISATSTARFRLQAMQANGTVSASSSYATSFTTTGTKTATLSLVWGASDVRLRLSIEIARSSGTGSRSLTVTNGTSSFINTPWKYDAFNYRLNGSGGGLLGGQALVPSGSNTFNNTATGGALCAGTATNNIIVSQAVSGGALGGGTSTNFRVLVPIHSLILDAIFAGLADSPQTAYQDTIGNADATFVGTPSFSYDSTLERDVFNVSKTVPSYAQTANGIAPFKNGMAFTVMAWVYDTGSSASYNAVICARDASAKTPILLTLEGNKYMAFWVETSAGADIAAGGTFGGGGALTQPLNAWRLWIGSWESGQISYLYSALPDETPTLVAQSSGTITGPASSVQDVSTASVGIGKDQYFSDVFDGKFGDIVVLNRTISPQEMRRLANPTYRVTYSLAFGTFVGGTATVSVTTGGGSNTYNITATGGALCGGTATVYLASSRTATGGVLCAGTATCTIIDTRIATGGALCGSSATNFVTKLATPSGGVLCAGTASNTCILQRVATGGVVCSSPNNTSLVGTLANRDGYAYYAIDSSNATGTPDGHGNSVTAESFDEVGTTLPAIVEESAIIRYHTFIELKFLVNISPGQNILDARVRLTYTAAPTGGYGIELSRSVYAPATTWYTDPEQVVYNGYYGGTNSNSPVTYSGSAVAGDTIDIDIADPLQTLVNSAVSNITDITVFVFAHFEVGPSYSEHIFASTENLTYSGPSLLFYAGLQGNGGTKCAGSATVSKIYTNINASGGVKVAGTSRIKKTGPGILTDRDGYASLLNGGGGSPVTTSSSEDGYGGITGGSGAVGNASTTLRCATNAGNSDYSILQIEFNASVSPGDTIIVELTYTQAPTGSQPLQVVAAIEPAIWWGPSNSDALYTDWTDLETAYNSAVSGGYSNSPQTLSGSASAGGTVTFDVTTAVQALRTVNPDDFHGFLFFLKAYDDPNGFGAEHFFAAIENTTYTEPTVDIGGGTGTEDFDENGTTLKLFRDASDDISILEIKFPVSIPADDVILQADLVLTYASAPVGAANITAIAAVQNDETPVFDTTWDDVLATYTTSNQASSQVLSGSAGIDTRVTLGVGPQLQTVSNAAGSTITSVVLYVYGSVGTAAEHDFGSLENIDFDGARLLLSTRAPTTHNISATGGAVVAGSATVTSRFRPTLTGGALCAGSAEIYLISYRIATGGVLCAGTTTSTIVDSRTATGGIVVGGTVTPTESDVINGTGGTVAAGSVGIYLVAYRTATGGVLCASTATNNITASQTATGGVVCAGSATNTIVDSRTATGGVVVAGTASIDVARSLTANGGVLAAGTVTNNISASQAATGGVLCAGSSMSTIVDTRTATGGILCAGTTTFFKASYLTATGGVVVAGTVTPTESDIVYAIGGILVAGTADIYLVTSKTATGGVLCAGSSTQNSSANNIAIGGIVVAGTATHNIIASQRATGGVVCAGSGNLYVTSTQAYIPTGGVVCGGIATNTIVDSRTATGGTVASSNTTFGTNYANINSTGGTVVGSAATLVKLSDLTATGGVLCGSTATPTESDIVYSTGGIVYAGSATATIIISQIATGGAIVAGSSTNTIVDSRTATGGVLCAGTATNTCILTRTASGGVIVAGSAILAGNGVIDATGGIVVAGSTTSNIIATQTAIGGAIVAGSTTNNIVDTRTATGGVVCAGSAINNIIATQAATGGAIVAGSATNNIVATQTATGGALANSTVAAYAIYSIATTGGSVVSGSTTFIKTTTETAISGVLCAGSATNTCILTRITTGGVVCAGSAQTIATYTISITGGVVVGATVTSSVDSDLGNSGGACVSGLAELYLILNPQVNGGIIVSGTTSDNAINATGGVTLSGQATLSYTYIDTASGGVVTSGTPFLRTRYQFLGARGGVSVSGLIETTLFSQDNSTGGIKVAGASTISHITLKDVYGGVVTSGTSFIRHTTASLATGGVILQGAAEVATGSVNGSTGGTVASGQALDIVINTLTAIGGIKVDGTTTTTLTSANATSGGLTTGSSAIMAIRVPVFGGAMVAGSAVVTMVHENVARGGIVLGTTVDDTFDDVVEVFGGAIVTGIALIETPRWNFYSDGGEVIIGSNIKTRVLGFCSYVSDGAEVIMGGTIDDNTGFEYEGNGTIVCGTAADIEITTKHFKTSMIVPITIGGTAIYSYIMNSSGGCRMGGTCQPTLTEKSYEGSGTIIIGGENDVSYATYSYTWNKQIFVSGSATCLVGVNASGGCRVGGTCQPTLTEKSYEGSGDIIVSGESSTYVTMNTTTEGPIVIGGEASCMMGAYYFEATGGVFMYGLSIDNGKTECSVSLFKCITSDTTTCYSTQYFYNNCQSFNGFCDPNSKAILAPIIICRQDGIVPLNRAEPAVTK